MSPGAGTTSPGAGAMSHSNGSKIWKKAAKQWKEDMQDLALWECATTNELPWVPWMSRDRAARHLNRGSPSSEEDESEALHEETPALPMHQGKDENEANLDG